MYQDEQVGDANSDKLIGEFAIIGVDHPGSYSVHRYTLEPGMPDCAYALPCRRGVAQSKMIGVSYETGSRG